MKIVPLAAESLGVRSMATLVEVGTTSILIDPGATLAPSRYGLPPATEEWEALRRANDRISAYATRASFIFVSHYHEDHFRSDPATYEGRAVLAKDPRRMVQGLQARRGAELWKALDGRARLGTADGWTLREPALTLEGSSPLAHGVEGTTLGYVVALTVEDPAERQRFVFASDVQGPLSPVVAAFLARQRPTVLYLSGPPSYIERELSAGLVNRGMEHLQRVMDVTGCRVIMDHYALRDPRWRERFAPLWETGRVVTAARWLGMEETPLEARRAHLWQAVRKPVAKAAAPRVMMTRAATRRLGKTAKGGYRE
jgi:hypothetical protein